MARHFNWDRVVAVASWVIVFVLLYGVVFILTQDLNTNNFIVQALGMTATRVIFGTLYLLQAGLLGYAKWKKKNTLRRHALLFIYLTGFFFSILSFSLNGFTIRLVSNIVLSTCAAVCWLHWTFKTRYLEEGEIYGPDEDREVA